MTDENPGLGHNQPPADEFTARLEAQNDALLDREVDLELASGKLPHEITSDEDVAQITRWVRAARDLANKEVEVRRVEMKAPYLERERQIDDWFGKFKKRLIAKALEIEQRSTPYLQAKQARAQAEARARQEAAAAERRRQEAAAEEARRVEREAARAPGGLRRRSRPRRAGAPKRPRRPRPGPPTRPPPLRRPRPRRRTRRSGPRRRPRSAPSAGPRTRPNSARRRAAVGTPASRWRRTSGSSRSRSSSRASGPSTNGST